MPIPTTRLELLHQLHESFDKLDAELVAGGPEVALLPTRTGWTVKELLAVRAWWSKSVVDWIEAGRRGRMPVTPKQGYGWRDTPRLNAEIVSDSKSRSYRSICSSLRRNHTRALTTIGSLDDRQLLSAGVYAWADKWPISRWLSVNTARQYVTARTEVRWALRQA